MWAKARWIWADRSENPAMNSAGDTDVPTPKPISAEPAVISEVPPVASAVSIAALYKRFARIDAWPLCLDARDVPEMVRCVSAVAPGFGGISPEDIAAPRCFEVERRLREALDVPVFHDDQHGTAVVVLGALVNALRVTGKELGDVRVVLSGAGAAGIAIIRLL
jgi:malic enzyme